MQVDKEIWGPDAREFKPERWFAADIADKEKAWLVVGLKFIRLISSAFFVDHKFTTLN